MGSNLRKRGVNEFSEDLEEYHKLLSDWHKHVAKKANVMSTPRNTEEFFNKFHEVNIHIDD